MRCTRNALKFALRSCGNEKEANLLETEQVAKMYQFLVFFRQFDAMKYVSNASSVSQEQLNMQIKIQRISPGIITKLLVGSFFSTKERNEKISM